jgi:hypothetical protein
MHEEAIALQSTSSLITALGKAPLSWLLVTTGVGKARVCTAVIFQIQVECLYFPQRLRTFDHIYGFPIETLLCMQLTRLKVPTHMSLAMLLRATNPYHEGARMRCE